jgi:hypothetical protein
MSEIIKLLTDELPNLQSAEVIAAISKAAQDIGVVLVRDEDPSASNPASVESFGGEAGHLTSET